MGNFKVVPIKLKICCKVIKKFKLKVRLFDMDEQMQELAGTKKRRVMTQDLSSRFKSKDDFIRYFKDACK